MQTSHSLPFPALVGLETAQQALMLLAVEPRLRGVVLASPAGTGKSSLARGLRSLLGEEAVPFVEIPTSVDVENLLGGLDLNATLAKGSLVTRKGTLARADQGVVYVDGINLMDDSAVNLLLAAMDEGEVRVEREGISLRNQARFSLIGSYDPAEGTPRSHLLDRVGLLVTLPGLGDQAQRAQVVHHNLATDHTAWEDESALLYGMVQAAREQLREIPITPEQVARLSRTALAYGVQGHRVDLFAAYAARAAAALALHDEVEEEDLALAVRLVILPRATQIPVQEPDSPPPSPEPPPPPPSPDTPPPPEDDEEDEETTPPEPDSLEIPEEQIFAALMTELPQDLENLPFNQIKRSRAGSRGATAGKRGRHIRSIPGDPRRHRIDALATLRVAAPWQGVRRGSGAGDRGSEIGDQGSGIGEQGLGTGEQGVGTGDWGLGTGAQSPNLPISQSPNTPIPNTPIPNPPRRVLFLPSDIRVKQYRSKAGALFCFAVDASGSMALHRMRQAKGAVHALLQKAYVKRDRVALIAFRGQAAEVLMPPSQSVELARRALDVLPTGGGTPLASALLAGREMADQARMRGIMQSVLVLLTDGRGNVPWQEGQNPKEELQQICRYVAASGLHVVVVDTQRSYLSRGEARQLADWLGGDYAYLPGASGDEVADFVDNLRS
jgi:magnesium chelatase subunit D